MRNCLIPDAGVWTHWGYPQQWAALLPFGNPGKTQNQAANSKRPATSAFKLIPMRILSTMFELKCSFTNRSTPLHFKTNAFSHRALLALPVPRHPASKLGKGKAQVKLAFTANLPDKKIIQEADRLFSMLNHVHRCLHHRASSKQRFLRVLESPIGHKKVLDLGQSQWLLSNKSWPWDGP